MKAREDIMQNMLLQIFGGFVGGVSALMLLFFSFEADIAVLKDTRQFEYEKFLLEKRISTYMNFRNLIGDPRYSDLAEDKTLEDDPEYREYIVNLRTSLAKVELFFPGEAKLLLGKVKRLENFSPADAPLSYMVEVSNKMKGEFDYQLSHFGYKEKSHHLVGWGEERTPTSFAR